MATAWEQSTTFDPSGEWDVSMNRSSPQPDEDTPVVWVPLPKTFFVFIITSLIVVNNIINLVILRKMTSINAGVKALMASMSVSDLLLGVFVCVPGMMTAFIHSWPFSSAFCQITGMINGMSISVSMWSLTGITVERFLVIVQPIYFRHRPRLHHIRMGIAFIWIFNVFYYGLPVVFREDMIYYVYQPSVLVCGFVWDHDWLFYLGGAIYPLGPGLLIVGCSYKIIMAIRKSNMKVIEMTSADCGSNMTAPCKQTSDQIGSPKDGVRGPNVITTQPRGTTKSKFRPKSGDRGATAQSHARSIKRVVLKREAKVSKVMIITAAAFFTCSLPYLTTATAEINNVIVSPWHSFIVMWLLNCNSFINVFIYSTVYKEFRQLFRTIFLCSKEESTKQSRTVSGLKRGSQSK